MLEFLSAALASIPAAATSRLAFLAYLAALITWSVLAYRVRSLENAKASALHLPEKDRLPFLIQAFGEVRVKVFSAGDYIRLKRQRYVFLAFLAACATGVVIVGLAARDALDRERLTNELIEAALLPPSSDIMSAVNVLNAGPRGITDLASTMQVDPSQAELEAIVDRLVQEGKSSDEIMAILRGGSQGAQLQNVNQQLIRVSLRIDGNLSELAECFRQQRCISSASSMVELCRHLNRVLTDIHESNRAAMSIPGVTFAQSESEPVFGDGALDRFFEEVTIPNATYLAQFCV